MSKYLCSFCIRSEMLINNRLNNLTLLSKYKILFFSLDWVVTALPHKAVSVSCIWSAFIEADIWSLDYFFPCCLWHCVDIYLCVISTWCKPRIAEGTCWSSIFRWTLMSLTLITVHNQRHHFILNLAEQSIFQPNERVLCPPPLSLE